MSWLELFFSAWICVPGPQSATADAQGIVVTVRQEAPADFVGDDAPTLIRALALLENGGTLILGPGRYVIRRTLFVPAGVVLRGEPGAVLALPSPGVTRAEARAGTRELLLTAAGEFGTDGKIGLVPPVGSPFLPDGESVGLGPLALAEVDGDRLVLVQPLQANVPAGSRISYPIKLIWTARAGRLTLRSEE